MKKSKTFILYFRRSVSYYAPGNFGKVRLHNSIVMQLSTVFGNPIHHKILTSNGIIPAGLFPIF